MIAGNRNPCRATISCLDPRGEDATATDVMTEPHLESLWVDPERNGSSLLNIRPSICICVDREPRSRDCPRFDHVPVVHMKDIAPNSCPRTYVQAGRIPEFEILCHWDRTAADQLSPSVDTPGASQDQQQKTTILHCSTS